jgi:hypothetical protein
MMLIKFLFSILTILTFGQGNPWFEIESQIRAKQKKLDEVNLQLREKMKPQFKLSPEEAEAEFVSNLSDLKEQKQNLMNEIEKLTQELNYRFPERGLKLGNSAVSEPVKKEVTSVEKKIEVPKIKEDAVDHSMKALRRQFGTPLSPEETKQLKEKTSSPSSGSKKSGKNPIDDKIIISN